MWINQLLSSLYIFYQTLTCTHTMLYVCHFLYCQLVFVVQGASQTCKILYTGFFMPLNFHKFHKLFWINEIKFVKCCRAVIGILKFLVKTHGFVKF